METVWKLLHEDGEGTVVPEEAPTVAEALNAALHTSVYPDSLVVAHGILFALARDGGERYLVLVWPAGTTPAGIVEFHGDQRHADLPMGTATVLEAAADADHAEALRKMLPWTGPQLIAGRPSIGLGDRLGLATPGHVRAVEGTGYVPMLAQQSIREMTRTQRTPRQVMADATYGVLQTGFRSGFGADADHLKTPDDIDACRAAGFTFYTIDPGDHVADEADGMDAAALAEAFAALPWDALQATGDETLARYVQRPQQLTDAVTADFDEASLHRAAVKYGRAIAHTAAMYRHLVDGFGSPEAFELEVSVDETESPTTPAEHYYVAQELHRLGVRWVSLAPRFVGRFEKGVDYLGDLAELERTFDAHVVVARRFGDYKISLHSGSDKFSVYAMAAKHGPGRVHVKTAGTSYLEALRVLARHERDLFREILDFARDRYDTDKATYHVSADVANVPPAGDVPDDRLPDLLDDFDARQVLHVTFGSVLTEDKGERFRRRLMAALKTHEAAYEAGLEAHFARHIGPFMGGA